MYLQPPNLSIPRASEGMALVGGPIVELLNYCTAVMFDTFEAAESKYSKCLVHSRYNAVQT